MKKILFVILILFVIGVTFAHADVVIIINSKSDVSSIDKNTIKDIYLGKKTKWSDDTQVMFVTLQKGAIHQTFLKKIVKKNPSQFKSFWRQKLFLGKTGKLPIVCESMDEVINYVAANPGSIGYISSTNDISNGRIKQILIIH